MCVQSQPDRKLYRQHKATGGSPPRVAARGLEAIESVDDNGLSNSQPPLILSSDSPVTGLVSGKPEEVRKADGWVPAVAVNLNGGM